MALLFGDGGLFQSLMNPTQWWDYFKNGKTNELNYDVAMQNLGFQKETQEYNKALQERIFQREDTALERQAEQLTKLGINPLSQQMNGLGAGQAIPETPRQNTFQAQDTGILSFLAPVMESINAIDNLNTTGVQRDSIRSQINQQEADTKSAQLDNQRKNLENIVYANEHGITFNNDGSPNVPKPKYTAQQKSDIEYEDAEATRNRNQREDQHQQVTGAHDGQNKIANVATDVTGQAIRATDYLITQGKKAVESGKQAGLKAEKKIVDTKNKVADEVSEFYDKTKKRVDQAVENTKEKGKKARDKVSNYIKDLFN